MQVCLNFCPCEASVFVRRQGGSRGSLLGRSAWQRLTNGTPSARVGPAVVTHAKAQIWLVERRARTSFEDAQFQVSFRLQVNEVWFSLAMLATLAMLALGSLGTELGLVHTGGGAAHLCSAAQNLWGTALKRDCLSHPFGVDTWPHHLVLYAEHIESLLFVIIFPIKTTI